MNDPFWFVTWITSEWFAFFGYTLLVQGAIFIFRVQNPRRRAFFRTIPLFALLVDPLLNQFSIGNFINPLSCESCVQKIALYFLPELKAHLASQQISLFKYLSFQFSSIPIITILIAFTAVTASICVWKIARFAFAYRSLNKLIQNGRVWEKRVENNLLRERIKQYQVEIRVSGMIDIPVAVGTRTILIPTRMIEQFTLEELEAVIAHELGHLQSKDPNIRLFNHFLAGFFWWIPVRWWLNRIEEDQEMACDESIAQYDIERESLASALLKAVRMSRNEISPHSCGLASRSSSLFRLKMIVDPHMRFQEKLIWQGIMPVAFGLVILVGCLMS